MSKSPSAFEFWMGLFSGMLENRDKKKSFCQFTGGKPQCEFPLNVYSGAHRVQTKKEKGDIHRLKTIKDI
jgi:hypothetical protein